MPLTFPEEQYNIAGLADLWLNCLDALGDALERRGLEDAAAALDARIEAIGEGDMAAADDIDGAEAAHERLGRSDVLVIVLVFFAERHPKEGEGAYRRAMTGVTGFVGDVTNP